MKKIGYSCIQVIQIISCASIKVELVYNGYSNKGKHARGLSHSQNYIAVSGCEGYYAWFNLTANQWYKKNSIR